jgi:hypothetical protein
VKPTLKRGHHRAPSSQPEPQTSPGEGAPESKPRPLVVLICALAVFFLVAGAILIVVGVHDASLTETGFGITAGAAVLVLVSAVMFVAFWQLCQLVRSEAWPQGKPPSGSSVVFVACLFSFLVGIYIFFTGIRTTNPQRFVVVFAALLFISAAVVGVILFGRDLEGTFARVGGAVAIALLGTAIGAYEFWYQNQYTPSHAGGSVALKVSLQRAGEQGPFSVIRARIGYETIGGKSVSAIGSAYTLTGSQILRCSRSATVQRVGDYFKGFLLDPQRLRFMADARELQPTVLAAGKFVADGKRLDPNVAASRELVFLVPHDRYQLLRFRAQLFAIPGSVQLSQSTPPQTLRFPGNNELYEYWHIHDDSWAHDLISGRERWVVTRYELVDPNDDTALHNQPNATEVTPAFHVFARFPRPTWHRGLPSERATLRLFDKSAPINAQEPGAASEPFADTELAVNKITTTCG